MKVDNINKWLTLIANAGVLVGIMFLAYEIQLSRKATLAEVYQDRAETRANLDLQVALNSPVFHKILFEFDSALSEVGVETAVGQLDEESKYLLGRYYEALMINFDNVVFQYGNGFISESYYDSLLRGIRRFTPVWEALGSNDYMLNELKAAALEQ